MPPPPAKPEGAAATPPAAAKAPEKPAPAPAAEPAAAAPAAPKGLKSWLPAIVALVIAPAVTWATAHFVMVPRLKEKLNLPPPSAVAMDETAGAATDKDGKPKGATTYEFSNVVVNLAGTMGTRYLKVSFHVVGDPKGNINIKQVFDENRTKLYDMTLNVLSSLTLADLEEAGAKNVIREKLVSAYNQALGKKVAEQVWFSDFVVQ